MSRRIGARRGWVVTDAVVALVIVSTLTGLLAVATRRTAAVDQHLVETVDANRLAERTILQLQRHQPADAAAVKTLPDPAPPGFRWVAVSGTSGDGRATVTALVPATGLKP